MEDGGEDGDCEEPGPEGIRSHETRHTQDLAHEDGDREDELVDGPDRPAEVDRRDLREVHRGKTRVETRVEPKDETTEDQELVRAHSLRQQLKHHTHQHRNVVPQQTPLPNATITAQARTGPVLRTEEYSTLWSPSYRPSRSATTPVRSPPKIPPTQ